MSSGDGRARHDPDGGDSCNNILLYLQDSNAQNGIGCQLNNYILAVIMTTYTNRSLVAFSDIKSKAFSTSQFGCPSGNVTVDDATLPFGLNRILQNPNWLTRGCSIPCLYSYNYSDLLAIANNRSVLDIPCTLDGRNISVLPMDSEGLRNLANRAFFFRREGEFININYAHLYERIGATPTEIEWFVGQGKLHYSHVRLWDQLMSLLNRKGLLIFQPWVNKDVAERMKQVALPQNYIAVHIRRGDKIRSESKKFVYDHWEKRGYNKSTQPTNYVPFAHYMEKLKDDENIKTVYVATDDPTTVKEEIENFTNTRGYNFVMNPDNASSMGHINTVADCQRRYIKTVSAIMDLMILGRADIFLGEFSSNWGRLLRTWRTSFVNNTVGTGKPRHMYSVFGNRQNPGW